MNKIITAGCVAVVAFAAVAMPNKRELADARRIVEDETKADLAAFKAGNKPAKDVADAHVSLAEKAENQAEKYLLYQGAFKLYARCEEYDLAADALRDMQREVKDVPPEVITELVGDELRYVPDGKAPRLVAMLKEAKRANPAEDSTEKTRKSVAKLFPGWSLDTEVYQHEVTGFHANHRGQDNVVCVHPKDRRTPAIISRTIILSDKNPCLFLKVASWNEESDYLLSVRVNGKEALTQRLIRTPDSAPWEDVIVPLSDWRGSKVKIEVVFAANGWHAWWPENPMLACLEIGEGGDADEKLYLDVVAELRRKGGSGKERANIVLSRLFPGWTVTAGERIGDMGGFTASHRGKNNVFCSHPISGELPMILSREVKLPFKNPCLLLTVSSFDQKSDCLLTVRVNGKDALPARRINTPDNAPWEDVVVPLSAWSGQKVKIEIVNNANNWWCEHLFLSRIEIAENARCARPSNVKALGNTQRRVAKLFPGWSLDTPVAHEAMNDENSTDFFTSHRGLDNVICVHPLNESTPAVISRTLKLSDKNPCLFLKVSSWAKNIQGGDCDFLLSVRVNGKDALTKRRICTPDAAPWEDVVVPLSNWRGKNVKIEVVLIANGWWHEFPILARIEVSEGNGDGKATIDGYTWSYRVNNGEAMIVAGAKGNHACAVSPNPKGHLAIPVTIEGVKVMGIGEHAFFGCGELNSVMIPVGVKNICNGAFYYCSGLTSISISSSVTDIVPTAFVALHSVKSFSVASDNPSYSSRNGLLCSKDGSVLVAGVNGDVTIPLGVKTIGRQAFLGRGLDMTVTIPSSVTKIEERAFAYCLGLTSVTMCGERPEAPDDVFGNCGQLTAIHVPANVKSWAGMKEWQGKPLVFDAK